MKHSKIIYQSEYNGDYTKERFIEEIRSYMEITKDFDNLTKDQFEKSLNRAYEKVLYNATWECPSTYCDQFDKEDIEDILQYAKM